MAGVEQFKDKKVKAPPLLQVDLSHDRVFFSDPFYLLIKREGVHSGTLSTPVDLMRIAGSNIMESLEQAPEETRREFIQDLDKLVQTMKDKFRVGLSLIK